MPKPYLVPFSADQRGPLYALIQTGNAPTRTVRRAAHAAPGRCTAAGADHGRDVAYLGRDRHPDGPAVSDRRPGGGSR
jgi:hypothetical protein